MTPTLKNLSIFILGIGVSGCGATALESPIFPTHQVACVPSQTASVGTTTTRTAGSTAANYPYLEYLPADYASAPSATYPLIIYLHDYTELIQDTATLREKMERHGPFRRIKEGRHFPAIILAPKSETWWDMNALDTFMTYARSAYRVDPSRVYLTGNGMGGGGVFDYLVAHPERLTAAVPIAAGAEAFYKAAEQRALRSVPHLSIHNFKDNIMGWGNSQRFGNSLGLALGAKNKMHATDIESTPVTTYFDVGSATWKNAPGTNLKNSSGEWLNSAFMYVYDTSIGTSTADRVVPEHDAWTTAYANEQTWEWMFCQKN